MADVNERLGDRAADALGEKTPDNTGITEAESAQLEAGWPVLTRDGLAFSYLFAAPTCYACSDGSWSSYSVGVEVRDDALPDRLESLAKPPAAVIAFAETQQIFETTRHRTETRMTDQPHDQALARPEGTLERPQAQEKPKKSSVMAALEELELEELRDYCQDISVDGVIAQTVSLSFERGQSMWCSKGSLISYDEGIDWTLKIPGGAGKAVSRVLSGEGVSLTYTTANRPGASLVLGANQAGRLVTWDLSQGPIVCTSGSFVAALGDVNIDVTMAKRAGAAFFGGAGLFMQKLSGDGVVILHGSGDFIEKQLDPGEKVLVSTGNLAVFSDGVDYNIRRTGGCLKSIFGGEGIFMTELTGPGWVMMQSMKKLPVQGQGQQM